MKTSSFGYLLKEGFRNVIQNRLMSVASIGVLTACLLMIGGSVLLTMNINSIVGYVEDQNEVLVFVEDGADDELIQSLEMDLNRIKNVHEVIFVSKEEALETQMELLAESADLLAGFEEDNPFPDSFRLKIDDLSTLEDTLEEIRQIEGVESISASTELAATITDIKRGISFAGTYIVAIMSLVSLVIVANTTKITVFSRRREINIMKYVGATDAFIRMPFLIEGILLGLAASVLAFFLLWGGYSYATQWLSTAPSTLLKLAYTNLVNFKAVSLRLFGGFAAAGTGIGALGSMVFIGKFLKV